MSLPLALEIAHSPLSLMSPCDLPMLWCMSHDSSFLHVHLNCGQPCMFIEVVSHHLLGTYYIEGYSKHQEMAMDKNQTLAAPMMLTFD